MEGLIDCMDSGSTVAAEVVPGLVQLLASVLQLFDRLVHVARAVGKLSIKQKYFGRILATQDLRIAGGNLWEKYRRI